MIRIINPILLVLILTASANAIFSQGAPRAELVDELRTVGMNCEEGFAKMDSYFAALGNNPAADGVIVIYGDVLDRKAASRREQQIRNHIQMRRFDLTRITFLRGNVKSQGATQFWLIPPGAERPEVSGGIAVADAGASAPSGPYLYAADYLDGIPGCNGNLYDLAEYSGVLQSHPTSMARIVISESSQAKYRRKVREIVSELARNGIQRKRIVTAYKYVRPNRLLEVTELWVVPPKRSVGLLTTENELPIPTHRCPQGGLAWLARC